MSLAIKVENLSKMYQIGEIGTGTISRDIERWARTKILKQEDPFLKIGEANDRSKAGNSNVVYSLKDINFEIEQGDAVGIIGRNGAGKSTLLKLLSRVTSPTTGRIGVKGRIASLLEVGTGFHPELSGRENIYLNGAILGMRKKEIDRKLDEIIDFSGVERYIDTPVKRYSSGMYVRLAFAVAAHLESEILIVDEVLAVGDAEFQKKCLGKMGEVSKGEGRTVLFVSHNMAAVQSLCKNGILLSHGKLLNHSFIKSVVNNYIVGGYNQNQKKHIKIDCDHDYFYLDYIYVDSKENENDFFDEFCTIKIEISINVKKYSEKLHFSLVLKGDNGEPLFVFSHAHSNLNLSHGKNQLICTFPTGFFNVGFYFLDFYVIMDSRDTLLVKNDILTFNVVEGQRKIGSWMEKEPGYFKPVFDWSKKII